MLKFPRVKNMPSKHWSKNIGWKIREYLLLMILRQLRKVVQSQRITSIDADKVTTIDYTS